MTEYESNFDAREYAKQAKEKKMQIPSKWKCGKCNKINKKGIEYCIYCDNRYNPIYLITDRSKQGEDSHFAEISANEGDHNEIDKQQDEKRNHDKTQSQIGLDPNNKQSLGQAPKIQQINSVEPEHEHEHEHELQHSIDYASMEEVLDDIHLDDFENDVPWINTYKSMKIT